MADLLFSSFAQAPMGAAIEQIDTDQPLAAAPQTSPGLVLVHPDGTQSALPGPELTVLGPGGITGIDPRSFVRMDPPSGASEVEPNYLAFIEMTPIELPWLFTPAKPGEVNGAKHLRPWLVLVVVEAGPDVLRPGQPLPMVTAAVDQLPNLDDSWAWAHVQQPDPAATLPEGLPPVIGQAIARLVCPRRLQPSKRWLACVVPAFAGGIAAVGGPAGVDTAKAWDTAAGGEVTLPVYFSWEFSTGTDGDFESLVHRLSPVDHDLLATLGVTMVDAARPWLRDDLVNVQGGATVPVPGALRAFNSGPTGTATPEFTAEFQTHLETELNAPSRRLAKASPDGTAEADKTGGVAAPIYGGQHLVVEQVPIPDPAGAAPDWVQDLNYSIATRVAAGLGAAYIRTHQEELMARAWEQVGAIREANHRRRVSELAIAVSAAAHRRHVATLSPGETVLFAAPAAHRIKATAAGQTLATEILVSTLANGASTAAFARMMRPGGPVARKSRVSGADVLTRSIVAEISVPQPATVVDRTPPAAVGDGLSALSQSVLSAVNVTHTDVAARRVVALQAVADVARANNLVDQANAVDGQLAALAVDHAALRAGDFAAVRSSIGAGLTAFSVSTQTAVGVLNTPTFTGAAQKVTKFGVQVRASDLSTRIVSALEPTGNILRRLAATVRVPSAMSDPFAVTPVMTYPQFPVPTALALLKDTPEWFVPGIGDIPSESVTLLQPDENFVESYLVGLAHEFNRELRWREYPTDVRGTPFNRFWPRPDGAADIAPIHTWRGRLGSHLDQGGEGVVVLFVRGTVVRRFPQMVVAAAPRQGLEDLNQWRKPFFVIPVDPQTAAYAFKIGEDEVQEVDPGSGRSKWFFVFQEHGYRIRFGFDEPEVPAVALAAWNDLSWDGVPTQPGRPGFAFAGTPLGQPPNEQAAGDPIWGHGSADVARIAFQQPVRVFRSARTLLLGD
jgi:hypothetical protein